MAAFPYQLQRSPEFDMSAAAHIFEQPINYIQSSSYAPSSAFMDYATWSPKAWNSMFTGRTPNDNIYPDPEANLNQSQYAYMLPSQGISSDLAQPNSAPTAGSVSSPETTEPARTLPTPTSRCPQATSSANFLPDGTWAPAPDYKSSFWTRQNGPERPIPSPSQPQDRSKNKYVNINPTPEILFSYPLPTTAEERSSTAAPSGNGNGSPVYPVLETLDSEYPLPTRQIRSSSLDQSSGQRLLALTECSSDMYGYSTSEKKRGSGTLVSGLSYTRVPHRDTGALFSLAPDMPEYHRSVVESVHRPVEPLGNQGY
ncbi:hypothetical protein N7520_001869 [Penicillium odoratum]|uniref:uncharacterized protein n=1 Tax=Penicillium odoratum TaxID=1167516 RepID=UPI0025482BB5|nr:uncharacterized protein N7520_001869 [Penicillium odoratum]KAJ5778623.1 hypothetical protein N7520_001869 [Penicillium odoratum]